MILANTLDHQALCLVYRCSKFRIQTSLLYASMLLWKKCMFVSIENHTFRQPQLEVLSACHSSMC